MDPSEASLLNESLRQRLAKHEGWSEAEFTTWHWLGKAFAERHLDPCLIGPDDSLANARAVGAEGTFAQLRGESLTPILDAAVRLARQFAIDLPPRVRGG